MLQAAFDILYQGSQAFSQRLPCPVRAHAYRFIRRSGNPRDLTVTQVMVAT